MRDLDLIAQDRATGIMLARYGQKYVVAEPLRAGTSFHGWMPRGQAKALFRTLTAKTNPRGNWRRRSTKWGNREMGAASKATWRQKALERLAAKRRNPRDPALHAALLKVIKAYPEYGSRNNSHKVLAGWLASAAGEGYKLTRADLLRLIQLQMREVLDDAKDAQHRRAWKARCEESAGALAEDITSVLKDRVPTSGTPPASPWWNRPELDASYEEMSNPPRDPIYQGAFTLGREPKKSGDYVDGDTAAVQTPHVRHPHLERDYEVWVFGMIDPRLGNTWNYVSGPMSKSDAIQEAKQLAR